MSLIGKDWLIGWLDTQVEQAEKDNKTDKVEAYRDVIAFLEWEDEFSLADIKFLDYTDKEGNFKLVEGIKIDFLSQYKIVISEKEGIKLIKEGKR